MPQLEVLVSTLLGIGILVAVTIVVLAAYGSPHPWSPALAILRGAVQLALVSFILSGVIGDARWVAAALAVMFLVATVTASTRIGWSGPHFALMVGAMALGAGVVMVVIFGTGAIELAPRYVLALGGIVIGNTMSIATLAGRRLSETVNDRWDEVEGWLALGATPRRSVAELARAAVYSGLIPSTDQTKTTGLVTLPGAFVGAIFGGLSPLEAGRFQIVVLAAIMAAGALTSVAVVTGLARYTQRPAALK